MISYLRKKLGRFWRHEIAYLILIITYIYANIQIITELPDTVLDTVIIEIVPVYFTVEGVLIGLSPQIKTKWLRDAVAVLGITSMLLAVRTLIVATYQHLQLNQSSVTSTTTSFVLTSILFLLFVELYAFAILIPVSEKRKSKDSSLNDFLNKPIGSVTMEQSSSLRIPRSLLTMVLEAFGYLMLFAIFGVALPLSLLISNAIGFWEALAWLIVAIVLWEIAWLRFTKKQKNLKYIPIGNPEAWFYALGIFFSIIGAGVALISVSTFGAQTISSSTCVLPPNVNATSLNCIKIQTIAQAPSGGPYSNYGPYGAYLVLFGEIGLPTFLITALMFYLWIRFVQTKIVQKAEEK